MGEHPDWVDGEPVESTALAPAPRDADGRIVRVDWSGGPPPPSPDPELPLSEQPAFTPQEQAEMKGETESPASFDDLDANVQAVYVDEAGYEQAEANIGKLEDLPNYAAIDADSAKLPDDAKVAALRLLSRWGQVDNDDLVAEYESLSHWLPLSSAGALREFLERYDFIKG